MCNCSLWASPKTRRSTTATVSDALAALARRRPDLLALQAGYEAQEQKYRAAIMSQFPALTVGFNRARDTSNVYTTGFQINLSLPIFNRNRGNVAIEQSTRQRLRDEYQNRLNQAFADVAHLRADDAILSRQLAADRSRVARYGACRAPRKRGVCRARPRARRVHRRRCRLR